MRALPDSLLNQEGLSDQDGSLETGQGGLHGLESVDAAMAHLVVPPETGATRVAVWAPGHPLIVC